MSEQLEMQDCYHKAEPGEPKFTLLARDPQAPAMIRLWAAIREGDPLEAINQFNELATVLAHCYPQENDEVKIDSACTIAGEMEQWKASRE